MYTDEFDRVQHCDTTSMLSTLRRSASEIYPTGGAGLTGCAALSHRRSKINYLRSSQLLSALICDEKVFSFEVGDE